MAKKIKREMITEHASNWTEFDDGDLCGPIDEVIRTLQALREEYEKKGYQNIALSVDLGYEGGDVSIRGDRPENDKEYERRVKQREAAHKREKERKIKRKEKELKELARLKKKYEEPGV